MESSFVSSLVTFIETSPSFLLRGPLIALVFSFAETVGVVGLFIPLNALFVGLISLAYSREDRRLLIGLLVCAAIIGLLLGLAVGYIVGKRYFAIILKRVHKKRPGIEKHFTMIDEAIEKNIRVAFPLMLFHIFSRPFMGLYLGSRKYGRPAYLRGSFIGVGAYIVPSVILGVLIGIAGDAAKDRFVDIYGYIIAGFILLLVLYMLYDMFSTKKF